MTPEEALALPEADKYREYLKRGQYVSKSTGDWRPMTDTSRKAAEMKLKALEQSAQQGSTEFLEWRPGGEPIPEESKAEPMNPAAQPAQEEPWANVSFDPPVWTSMEPEQNSVLTVPNQFNIAAPQEEASPPPGDPWQAARTAEAEPVVKDHTDASLRNQSKDLRLNVPTELKAADPSYGAPTGYDYFYEPDVDFVKGLLASNPEVMQAVGLIDTTDELYANPHKPAADVAKEKVKHITEDHRAYKLTADILYASRYNRAKEEGRPLVRIDLSEEVTPWQRRINKAFHAGEQALVGWAAGRTMGLSNTMLPVAKLINDAVSDQPSPSVDELRDYYSGGPAGVSEALGLLSPGSLTTRLAGAAMRGTGMAAAGEGTVKTVGSMLRGTPAAAAGAKMAAMLPTGVRTALGMGSELARAGVVGGVTAGVDAGVRESTEHLMSASEKALDESVRDVIGQAATGAGLGAGLHIPGSAAAALARGYQGRYPQIVRFEGAGGEVGFGAKLDKETRSLVDSHMAKVRAKDIGSGTPTDTLIDDATEPLLREGSRYQAETLKRAHDIIEPFYQHFKNTRQKLKTTGPAWKYLADSIRSARAGKLTGNEVSAGEMNVLKTEFKKWSRARRSRKGFDGEEGVLLPLSDAKELLGTQWLKRSGVDMSNWDENVDRILVQPAFKDPKQVDDLLRSYSASARHEFGDPNKSTFFRGLDAETRKLRDQIPEWSAIKREQEALLRRADDILSSANAPSEFRKKIDEKLMVGPHNINGGAMAAADELKNFQIGLASYAADQNHFAAMNEALQFLARRAGPDTFKKLRQIAQLREQAAVTGSTTHTPTVGLSLQAGGPKMQQFAGMHKLDRTLYPVTRTLGSSAGVERAQLNKLLQSELKPGAHLNDDLLWYLGTQRNSETARRWSEEMLGLRGGGAGRVAGNEDLVNLNTLIDVYELIEAGGGKLADWVTGSKSPKEKQDATEDSY